MAQLTKEQREEVLEIANECASAKLRRYTVRALVGFALLIGGGVIATKITNNQRAAADHATQTRIDKAVQGSCRRVNVLRAQSNLSDAVSYSILVAAAEREQSLAADGMPDVHRQSAHQFRVQATRLRVTPLTNCAKAVRRPAFYRTPSAGPIGDPHEIAINPKVERILDDSERLLAREGKE